MAFATLDELPAWAVGVLADARVARLGLIDDGGRPRVLPVAFALADGAAWSAVDDKPKRAGGRRLARVRWLERRPEAALLADVYDDDWSRLAWVQLLGRVELLEPAAARPGLEALAAKYAPYRERRPPGPVLRLAVERALAWRAAEGG